MPAEITPQDLVLLFSQWERHAMRRKASRDVLGLHVPTADEVELWLPRLSEILAETVARPRDQTPEDNQYLALRQLWEEWRKDWRAEQLGRALSHP